MSILDPSLFLINGVPATPAQGDSLPDDEDCVSAEDDAAVFLPDGIDDPTSWLTTQGWFDSEAARYEAMGSELGWFMAFRVREIAADFAIMDADSVGCYEARRATYDNV